jgi:hypothetical protein
MKLWTGLKTLWEGVSGPRYKTIDGKPIPGKLTLAFSQAADYQKIDKMFDPLLKEKMDPEGYVKKRYDPAFKKAVDEKGATFLKDDKDNVFTLTIAYKLHEPGSDLKKDTHQYTEIGTSLARMQGYKSAQLVIAALAINEWLKAAPAKDIVADIKEENVPSVKVYQNALSWEAEPDSPALDGFFEASYATITDDEGNPCPPPDKEERDSITMHASKDAALSMMAQILLEYMKQGELFNKHTEHTIPLDLSALEEEGLTKDRLEAIVGGNRDQKQILRL